MSFAGLISIGTVEDASRRLIPNTGIPFYNPGTNVLAILWTTRLKAVVAANPVVTDAYGNLPAVYADAGLYEYELRGLRLTCMASVDPGHIQPGQIIAYKRYAPAALATLLTLSTVPVDADATNLAVTFTVPDSGAVVVTMSARALTTGYPGWALRDTISGLVPLSACVVAHATLVARATYVAQFAGLTPGDVLTWKWAIYLALGAGSSGLYASDAPDVGQAYMQVQAL